MIVGLLISGELGNIVLKYFKKNHYIKFVLTDKSSKTIIEFCKNNKIIIAGSTWRNDLSLFENLDYKIIIAPHELDHLDTIKEINNSSLLSDCEIGNCSKYDVLIIDKIGILSKIYRYADIAYIGGGFGKGIHNCLEAVVYNIPVVFGPNYHKFQEAKDFISLGIAKSVSNSDEFKNAITNFEKLDIKQISSDYFKNKIGAAEIITQHI